MEKKFLCIINLIKWFSLLVLLYFVVRFLFIMSVFGMPLPLTNEILARPIPIPAVTYSEFLIEVRYKLNDEIKMVQDILIIEFEGVYRSLGTGSSYINWRKSLLGNPENDSILLFEYSENHRVYHSTGNPNFQMGSSYHTLFNDSIRGGGRIYSISPSTGTGILRSNLTKEELYEIYGIEIISFEIAPPIENTFEYSWWGRVRNRLNF